MGTLVALGNFSFQIPKGFAQKRGMNGVCYSLATSEKCTGNQSQLKISDVSES